MTWTNKMDEWLIASFPDQYTQHIADTIGCSYGQVTTRAKALGLKKSPEFTAKDRASTTAILTEAGKSTRRVPGQTPHNKGKKMRPETYEKVKATMFKPGQNPHNTQYDGHERVRADGYIYIRVRLGCYREKHRVVYEQHFGQIPKGMNVCFKDGNKLNCHPDNLELLTRKQLVQRNTIHRYPPELKAAIKTLRKLEKALNPKPQTPSQRHEKQN